jgi:hypothetical protein
MKQNLLKHVVLYPNYVIHKLKYVNGLIDRLNEFLIGG